MIESLAGYKITSFPGVNTPLQRDAPSSRLRASISQSAAGQRRRDGHAGSRRQALEGDDRRADHRRIRAVRDITLRRDQSRGRWRVQRHDRPAVALHGSVSIRDDETATNCRARRSRRVGIRGPQVMAGYWQRPDETAKVMTADGFFRSGDIASISEAGFVRIVDRKKDMILVSGFNVYPNEIEEVVANHPGARGRGDRRARRAFRRGRQAVRGQERSGADVRRPDGVL